MFPHDFDSTWYPMAVMSIICLYGGGDGCIVVMDINVVVPATTAATATTVGTPMQITLMSKFRFQCAGCLVEECSNSVEGVGIIITNISAVRYNIVWSCGRIAPIIIIIGWMFMSLSSEQ